VRRAAWLGSRVGGTAGGDHHGVACARALVHDLHPATVAHHRHGAALAIVVEQPVDRVRTGGR